MMVTGLVGKTIEEKLNKAFHPLKLEVIDESSNHHGHTGARPQGESHFRVKIMAEAFIGKSRIEQHRMINQVLAEELHYPVHALAIESSAPAASG